jgi:hypothetical protein
VEEDNTTGIRVPKGLKAILYQDENFTGKAVEIFGPNQFCQHLPDGFPAFDLSSLKVEVVPKITTKGLWEIATESNEEISTTLSETFSTQNGHTLTKTNSDEISLSFEKDFTFLTKTVGYSIGEMTSKSVQDITTSSTTRSCTASCTNPKNQPVALFQWKTITDEV